MADGESSGINNPSPSSGLSIQELINEVLSHPEFRNVVSNISNSDTSLGPSSSSHSGVTTSSDATYQSPAEELRGIFRRGTSTQQQQNINATLPLPRFTSRFSYQPRRRNVRRNVGPYKQASGGKQKTTSARGGQTTAKQQCFYREVVLLNGPDDSKVIRGYAMK